MPAWVERLLRSSLDTKIKAALGSRHARRVVAGPAKERTRPDSKIAKNAASVSTQKA